MARTRKRERLYQMLTEPPPGTPFAGYARYSSDMQDGATLITQHRRIQSFADAHGWPIVQWWDEPATSAKYDDTEKRPQFAAMLAAAGGAFVGILCFDNSRWSRNNAVTFTTLEDLRHRKIWWATSDGLWNSNRTMEDGHSIAFAVDASINANFSVKLSKRVIEAKEDRALAGYHQGLPPFGYLPPDYPPLPPGVGIKRKADLIPVRKNPETWPALQMIAELRLARRSCKEIAEALNAAGYRTRAGRWHGKHEAVLGEVAPARRFSEDTIWDFLHNEFYREFAPNCGKGTIITPSSNQRVIGQHEAAWDWATWHRMEEVAAELRYAPKASEVVRGIYPLAAIVVCAHCQLPMRSDHTHHKDRTLRYYRCSANRRGLTCTGQRVTTPAWRVEHAIGELLNTYRLGDTWQADLMSLAEAVPGVDTDAIAAQQHALRDEQEAFNQMLLAKGIDAARYRQETARIQRALDALARKVPTVDAATQAAMAAGNQIAQLPELWAAAEAHDDLLALRELVLSLFTQGGLTWDADARIITHLRPHAEYVPSLRMALHDWTWGESGFTRPASLSSNEPKAPRRIIRDPRTKTDIRREVPTQKYALSPEQQRAALAALESGQSMRAVARQYGVSHGAIWRLAHREIEDA